MAEEVPISNDEWVVLMDAAMQLEDDAARIAAMQAATDDWNGGSMSNAKLAKEVSANQTLQATRDNDISRWALGTADEVIVDPEGQPEPGYYPIRITRSGSTVWFPSIAKLQSEIAKGDKGDRGAEGASPGKIFVLVGGTADSDPGNGKIKFNADRTRVYVDNLDAGGADVTVWIDALDNQPTAVRMQLTVRQIDSDKVGTLNITGDTATATSYRKLTTVQVGDWPAFDTNARIAVVPTFVSDMMTEVTSATALANAKAGYAQTEGDYAKDQGDYALAKGEAADSAATAALLARDTASYKALFSTFALLDANKNFNANTLAIVADDPVPANNGTYVKVGASGSGSWNKVSSTGGLLFQSLAVESGYYGAFVDAIGRAAWLVRIDGTMEVRKLAIPNGSLLGSTLAAASIDPSKLDTATQAQLGMIAKPLNVGETGYAWAVVDAAGHIALGVKTDGSIVIPKWSSLTMLPLADGQVVEAKLADGSVSLSKLASALAGLVPKSMSVSETGYLFAIIDANNRMALAIKADGSVIIPKFTLSAGAVSRGNLDATLQGLIATALPPETGYLWGVVDAAGHIGLGIKLDGTVVGKLAGLLTAGSVEPAMLSTASSRQALPHASDLIDAMPTIWRQRNGEVNIETALGDGSLFRAFPDKVARLLRGKNINSAAIDVRRASGLLILGEYYVGDWSPGSYPSTNYKGYLLGPTVTDPSGTFATGDYYLYANGSSTAGTYGATPIYNGDALVYGSDNAWHVQSSPGADTSRVHKGWWRVTAAGSFDGKTYNIGDRILYISRQTAGGAQQFDRWYRGDIVDVARNDLWYRGEFTPASGYPDSPAHGEVYQASAAGTAGGVAYVAGDYAIYESGSWTRLENDPFRTYAAGESIALRCGGGRASEWEVRRSDKAAGASRLAVRLSLQSYALPRRAVDGVRMMSDSMGGNGGVFSQSAALLPNRSVNIYTNGGSSSRQVLGMLEYAITTGDLDLARLIVAWHGQNNQPGSAATDLNMAQIMECSLRMAELAGAHHKRVLFLSVLGQRNMTWTGTRIAATQQENQFNKTGPLWDLRQWYERTFPGMVLHPHAILLAAATDAPDPTFPVDPSTAGSALMTEKQVAAKYGVVPWSFHGVGGQGWATSQLVYKGTWNTAGLPTGGSPFDYYLRIGGGGANSVGNILVNEAGTWVERGIDITHLSNAGGAAMASGGAGSNLGAGYSVVPAALGIATHINNNLI